MQATAAHPLEPLTADEVRAAVRVLKDAGKVTPTTRFVSVALREPLKGLIHAFDETSPPPGAPKGPHPPVRRARPAPPGAFRGLVRHRANPGLGGALPAREPGAGRLEARPGGAADDDRGGAGRVWAGGLASPEFAA